MVKRMLIDATHPEETRVVVLNGNKLEEFDFETSTKKQLKGNIYLAKVTRVEPSLQAAFVDYGGNRHGFLAFNEIHPDYWRIPVADREALLAEHNADHDGDMLDEPARDRRVARDGDNGEPVNPEPPSDYPSATLAGSEAAPLDEQPSIEGEQPSEASADPAPVGDGSPRAIGLEHRAMFETSAPPAAEHAESSPTESTDDVTPTATETVAEELPLEAAAAPSDMEPAEETSTAAEATVPPETPDQPAAVEAASIDTVGGDDMEEVETRRRFKPMRHYKIQEVIKRRQVLLVQVVKEERGTKGAALTTYLSLAGRYCVLMPNTARGGGISRRITSAQDRKRLKSIMEDLDMPEGMAIILRTAGMERTKPEIKRDYEYLLRQWDDIREITLKSTAPCLVYEEGNLIKRAIRDLYSRDIEEILVEGEEGYKAAKAFMKTLMPSHVGRIQLYNDPTVPLFQRFQVEAQLDEMHGPNVRLKSGGYIVINPTEALVSIDVNSGRSTRERHIEETAFKTNLEAADEIARQLRLRDLAGLIVIDFIDMEDSRNQHAVERRLKEAMKSDRARIQIGRISPFGLLELSRQRLRPSLLEVSSERCPHCGGTGFVRSTESTALHVLRAIEEEGMKMRTAEAVVHVPTSVALYMLNQKRDALASVEARYGLYVVFNRDDALIPPAYRIERTRARSAGDIAPAIPHAPQPAPAAEEPEAPPIIEADSAELEGVAMAEDESASSYREDERGEMHEGDGHRRRRRRRRRRGRGEDRGDQHHVHEQQPHEQQPHVSAEAASHEAERAVAEEAPSEEALGEEARAPGEAPHHEHVDADGMPRRRRRGRRGGRRRGRRGQEEMNQPPVAAVADPFADPRYPEIVPTEHPEPTAPASAPAEERRPRRVEGPGDAYDWPWNRRAERFPEEHAREEAETQANGEYSPPAAAPSEAHEQREENTASVTTQPAPAPEQQAEDRASDTPAPAEAEPTGPAQPPRRGWWRRLTS